MDYMAMGKRIRTYRSLQGLTQAELAQQVGISISFMGHIERGSRVASLETLLSLSETLNVTLDTLVTGADPGYANVLHSTRKMRVLNDVMRVLSDHSSEWMKEE